MFENFRLKVHANVAELQHKFGSNYFRDTQLYKTLNFGNPSKRQLSIAQVQMLHSQNCIVGQIPWKVIQIMQHEMHSTLHEKIRFWV